VTGEGIEALRAALTLLGPRERDVELYPRLAVDRAFTLSGAGLLSLARWCRVASASRTV